MILHDAATLSGVRRTTDGYLVADARVARTGIQVYAGHEVGRPDLDVVRLYRPEEEVFSNDAMRTYAHRPVTLNHPEAAVTAETWRDVAIGQTGGEVVRDGEFVRVPMVIMDAAAIARIEAGEREISMGYTAEIEFADGVTPDGQQYDAVQKSLRMNHLAIVARARGGSSLKIGDTNRTRSADMADNAIKTRTVVLDGLSVETTDAGAQAIEKLQGVIEGERKKLSDAEASHAKALADKDAEIAKKDAEIDALKGKILTDADLDARVQARADLIAKAQAIAPQIETAGKSDAEIRKAAVVARLGDAAIEGKAEAYIDARFDILAEEKKDAFKDAMKGAPATTNSPDADKAYREMTASLRDAWKGQSKEVA